MLVRREQVTERRPVRAVERATQVRLIDVLRGPEGLGRPVRMVKPVKKLEQQAGVLGVNALDPQPAVFLVLADVLPGNEALRAGGRVRARPQERTPARV